MSDDYGQPPWAAHRNQHPGRDAATAGAAVAGLWLLLLVATGDLSWDDLPRLLLLFTALPAAVTYVFARRARSRWKPRSYLLLTVGLSLSVPVVLLPIQIFLL